MDRWSQLSMSEKSDLMSLYIRNGISSLEEIKKHYNSYDDGGELYLEGDDPDLTPLNLSKMYANNPKYGGNRYIDTTMLREIDNYMISKKVGLPQRQAIAYTVQQEGNTTGSHGNGATGLVGWRGSRAANLSKTTKGQAAKLYDEVYGTFNADNWNHGGKGSGYKSGKAAQQAFKDATTATEAAKALNYGYVRPPLTDRMSRTSNVEKMFKATGGHLYEDGGSHDNHPDNTRVFLDPRYQENEPIKSKSSNEQYKEFAKEVKKEQEYLEKDLERRKKIATAASIVGVGASKINPIIGALLQVADMYMDFRYSNHPTAEGGYDALGEFATISDNTKLGDYIERGLKFIPKYGNKISNIYSKFRDYNDVLSYLGAVNDGLDLFTNKSLISRVYDGPQLYRSYNYPLNDPIKQIDLPELVITAPKITGTVEDFNVHKFQEEGKLK